MADFRINIGNGTVYITTYGTREEAERIMHRIIDAVAGGAISVEEKTEQWTKVPT